MVPWRSWGCEMGQVLFNSFSAINGTREARTAQSGDIDPLLIDINIRVSIDSVKQNSMLPGDGESSGYQPAAFVVTSAQNSKPALK